MATLFINAHPKPYSPSYTQKMQHYFIAQWKKLNPNQNITVINLSEMDIPCLNDEMLTLFSQQMIGAKLSQAEQVLLYRMQQILVQFKLHHRVVIAMPLHNFNITAKLKDYMDNILIARETFRYTENGSVGLMTDDRKVFLLQSSGGIYENHERYTPLEFSQMYLREMFVNIMGFDKFYIARAQGTAIRSQNDVLIEGFRNIDTQLADFCQ
ncbi:NAD(P)H-dependent oxidoreductase [Acinetobacter nosocomialis]|uniref:FMN-dependent NADH-azoreductase n=1 Tax=Acinetobacter nosocomialis TaxID=106654 RepID=UPI0026EDB4A8|nr:NAD(P)H-dependent oxidoreductase [Acinetobacter nosocomialis]MDO7208672.1 NAD(P)H-dependent oxidoreductase [Acinetobacter nosocomialis]